MQNPRFSPILILQLPEFRKSADDTLSTTPGRRTGIDETSSQAAFDFLTAFTDAVAVRSDAGLAAAVRKNQKRKDSREDSTRGGVVLCERSR